MRVDRDRRPPLGADPSLRFPEIRRRTLGNGLRVWTVEHNAVPLVSFLALLPIGASADPADRPGLAAMTSDMLDEGCGELDALELHDALARIGGHLDSEIGSDATILTLTSLARHANRASALVADMIMRPRLDTVDFQRVRELRLNRLIQLRDLAPALADRAFARLLYRNHPYGHMPLGTEPSLQSVTLDEIGGFHRSMFTPSRMTVIAAGDASHDALAASVEAAFGDWRASNEAPAIDPALWPVPGVPDDRLALLHRPGAAQSELRIGHVGLSRKTPDYHALLVLNTILGGGTNSRMFRNIREKEGFAYDAHSEYDTNRESGDFQAVTQVRNDVLEAALKAVMSELDQMAKEPVATAELTNIKNYIAGLYLLRLETQDGVANQLNTMKTLGLPNNYLETYVTRVRSVEPGQVQAAAKKYIAPDQATVVIVGDASKIAEVLKKFGDVKVVKGQ